MVKPKLNLKSSEYTFPSWHFAALVILPTLYSSNIHTCVFFVCFSSSGEEGVHTEELDTDLGTSLFSPVPGLIIKISLA